jgi:hypothetical protein
MYLRAPTYPQQVASFRAPHQPTPTGYLCFNYGKTDHFTRDYHTIK